MIVDECSFLVGAEAVGLRQLMSLVSFCGLNTNSSLFDNFDNHSDLLVSDAATDSELPLGGEERGKLVGMIRAESSLKKDEGRKNPVIHFFSFQTYLRFLL